MKKQFFALLISIIVPIGTSAQNPTANFRNISIKEGLVGDHVQCIFQDSKGFIWIGTFAGLHRYDGYTFKVFNCDEPPYHHLNFIANNTVYAIVEDKKNKLWIGTENGLSRYDPEVDSFTNYYANKLEPSKGPSHNHIRAIHEDQSGVLWICTYGGGINSFNPETGLFRHFVSEDGNALPSPRLNGLYVDKNGLMWIGTENEGLVKYDPLRDEFEYIETHVTHNSTNPRNIVNDIIEDKYGKLWIGFWENGVCEFDRQERSMECHDYAYQGRNQLRSTTVRSLLEDSRGRLWMATFGGGLSLYNREEGSFITYAADMQNPTSISNNFLWTMFEDRNGLLWIGTYGSGVDIFTPRKEGFVHYEITKPDGSQNDRIYELYEASDGKVWVGTLDGGISILDRTEGQIQRFTRLKEAPFTTMRAFKEDGKGTMWIGTDRGLYQYETQSGQLKLYAHDPANPGSINESGVFSIAIDQDGNIWSSTWDSGINVLSPAEYEKHNPDHAVFRHFVNLPTDSTSISSNKVWTIYLDKNDDVWLGTESGLNKLDRRTGRFSRYGKMNIGRIVEDEAGIFWMGTYGQGIAKFNPKSNKLKLFNQLKNLDINLVLDMAQDKDDNLWIGSIDGITKFNIRSEEFVNLDLSNELKQNEYQLNVIEPLRSGELIMGGDFGIDIFDPDKIKIKESTPIVELTDFQIFNESVEVGSWNGKNLLNKTLPYTDAIELSHKEGLITLEFAALHYSSQEKHLYAYKLDGFDQEWNYTRSDKRKATYMNLQPGHYTFRVKAATREGNWSKERLLSIEVVPPFWNTILFRVVMGLILAVGLFFFVKMRLSDERRRLVRRFDAEKMMREQEIIALKNQQLDAELEHKKQELASSTLHNMQKIEELSHVKDELKVVLNDINGHPQERRIKNLIRSIDQNIEDANNWDHFENNLLQDDFVKRFMETYPKLTYKDLKICTFIRMNFDNKEIARMLNITPESLGVSRTRIRKKINLEKSVYLNDMILRF